MTAEKMIYSRSLPHPFRSRSAWITYDQEGEEGQPGEMVRVEGVGHGGAPVQLVRRRHAEGRLQQRLQQVVLYRACALASLLQLSQLVPGFAEE